MTPRQLRQYMENRWCMVGSNDLRWSEVTEELAAQWDCFSDWTRIYDFYFKPEFTTPMRNLGLSWPETFSGDYGKDVAQMFQAVRDAEYVHPHRIPDGVVCPEKSGWHRVVFHQGNTGTYVLFVGLDTASDPEDRFGISPPYVLSVGERSPITLDKIKHWGDPLPPP